ncbi:MAG: hypothetical protein ABIO44_03150 [Saprospiraceae bacterium]
MKLFKTIITILFLYSCGDDGPRCPGDIILPITIDEYKSIYAIGDTITISSKFYKLIYDKKTDKMYDASKYSILPIINFFKLDTTYEYSTDSYINKYCIFIKQKGSNLNAESSRKGSAIIGEYSLENDSLNFVCKLKLVQEGYFWIKIQSLTSGDSHLQNNYQFNCRGREINFKLESPNIDNIDLMKLLRNKGSNTFILSDSIQWFYNYAGYCLEVR